MRTKYEICKFIIKQKISIALSQNINIHEFVNSCLSHFYVVICSILFFLYVSKILNKKQKFQNK